MKRQGTKKQELIKSPRDTKYTEKEIIEFISLISKPQTIKELTDKVRDEKKCGSGLISREAFKMQIKTIYTTKTFTPEQDSLIDLLSDSMPFTRIQTTQI